MLYCSRLINKYFRRLNDAGLWLTSTEHAQLVDYSRKFCEGFGQLASMQARKGYRMYKIRPKMHMFQELSRQNAGDVWAINCLNASCWNDEDFIGRVSAISKSCYGLGISQSLRCMQKVLGKYKVQFSRIPSRILEPGQ